ncbi:atrial natriuretic peptide receptor 1-like isoform X3 [Tachypleus tridentatus]|uniref:atrial natriuretic peptide receptor 1-like isoform X3 n=1 Tax=Tachypleus tridentatus TaxID=6853 RepID=UPI003FD6A4B7
MSNFLLLLIVFFKFVATDHAPDKCLRNSCTHSKNHVSSFISRYNQSNYKREFNHSKCHINLVVLAPENNSLPYSLYKIMPSIQHAVKFVEDHGILNRNIIKVCPRNTHSSSTHGPLAAYEMYRNKTVSVFLGPVDSYVLAPVTRYTSVWEIPLLTVGGQAYVFDDKTTVFSFLTRMNGYFSQLGQVFLEMLLHFGWNVVAFLYHNHRYHTQGKSTCCFTLAAIPYVLINLSFHEQEFDETLPELSYHRLLQNVTKYGRVIVMCASPSSIRQILLAAEELGMLEDGDYVFFNVELFTSKKSIHRPWYKADDTSETNDRARKAYQSLLTITDRVPDTPEYAEFSREIKNITKKRYGFDYGEEEVSVYVTAFHEAVLLYALALNETLEEGGNITDGRAITHKMWNRTFEGITGNVSIDDNGDRNVDFSLLDMDPETGDFQVVANYYGVSKRFERVPGRKIHWAGDRKDPPPDTPPCGFEGNKCPNEEVSKYAIVSGLLMFFLLVLSIISFIIYRHFKREAELVSMTWKIKWEEITTTSSKNKHLGSKTSVERTNHYSSCSEETLASCNKGRQVFTKTGYYKLTIQELVPESTVIHSEHVACPSEVALDDGGFNAAGLGFFEDAEGAIVAIKPLIKTRIEIHRPLLLELKRMKDLQNDHIVRFIGACVEPPYCCIVTEYCPKGSLQDILENEEIKLDWMFRCSLLQDTVKGMAYLHNSEIRSHGNLKSSNCVVDSRFVLKITDIGLHALRTSDENENGESYAYWRKKLWTAPEILRMSNPAPEGTQKGDVYSFAIIAHEVVVRQGPFYLGEMDLSPKEIISRVKESKTPPFRPFLDEDTYDEEVLQMINKCWAEDPMERPDFHLLKSVVRRLSKENTSTNILDNLLSRMEQYANNLESLVEERTADYLEQKRKAEDLLYQLLPKSVASQLIRGEAVTAEAFDIVSIYFSDIVGFTSLSAQSTPMEVVDLLNDLYTCFDSIIENFDVYKVETIGDAYMVVSGLPVRNGNLHGREVARMSLALLNAVMTFKIRHRPGEQLKLRIGIHSGPCAAGVVGLKMPRYCLFGDTVNTASRMESNGEPLKIHVSPKTKEVLDFFGNFRLELRGEVEMKGKGKLMTYWLLEEVSMPAVSNVNNDPPLAASKDINISKTDIQY